MNVVHLMASPFLGGPERQVLGLARSLSAGCRTGFLSFAESGRARPFLDRARADGFEAVELKQNFPRVRRAIREVADRLRRMKADVLCCSGYKPDLIGWRAARKAGVPVVAIAHGWTGVTRKVRFYESVDRFVLRWFDAVACVSEGQANKARQGGVPDRLLAVIRNAIDSAPFESDEGGERELARSFFPHPPNKIVGTAGRLSPEKGPDVFVEAAALVLRDRADTGFLLCGEGPMRPALERRVAELGLQGRLVLAGFRTDLERLMPGWDLAVLSSHTEGLPVFVLEAQAAGLPVVATAVGGTPEVVEDGATGYLVPPASPAALAARIGELLDDEGLRRRMGARGKQRVREEFTFAAQAEQYERLFARLLGVSRPAAPATFERAGGATR